jgi:hypothetical protein
MPLFLVRFEHEDENVTCCLVRASFEGQAYQKVEKWLSQDCLKISADLYMDLEDHDMLKLEGISEIDSVNDLEKYLPLIDGYWPNIESVISRENS